MHNVENYLAAVTALDGLVPYEVMRETARPLSASSTASSRCGLIRGVQWYNDSIGKKSSPTRAMAGLNAFDEKVSVLAGGHDKAHVPLHALAPERGNARQAAHPVRRDTARTRSKKAVARVARACMRQPRDGALRKSGGLRRTRCERRYRDSPACAAFDRFANFMERGKASEKARHGAPGIGKSPPQA